MESNEMPPKSMLDSQRKQKVLPLIGSNKSFHKIANQELKMYVYPHLAGKDEVPIPGYYTAFNVYFYDKYALSNEI